MHLRNLLSNLHAKLSCKDINKLRKSRPASKSGEEEIKKCKNDQDYWTLHELSTIFQDAESLWEHPLSSRPTSMVSTTSTNTSGKLLDDPAIIRLCSAESINADDKEPELACTYDARASSKILLTPISPPPQQQETDILTLQTHEITTLCTHLNRLQNDLSYKSKALEHAHAELHFLRRENAVRFDKIRELASQVRELERVEGWSRKKLKQRVADLAWEVRGRELMMEEEREVSGELRDWGREWREYAGWLEGRVGME